ncbi:hypothetical protein Tbd_1944 [Thiobacillus denitrificans ATCC 25259]|uniref:Uncharacterized protein n=1 Tax=Thiobacillus denitrificans (strain ATCC 25259 / T1) TaxID=292415 RepID=Q3SHI9_THIDA|nr:hypothetical protein Tbd_1944 [Thiobacillus denitrificans ATCC 25259]
MGLCQAMTRMRMACLAGASPARVIVGRRATGTTHVLAVHHKQARARIAVHRARRAAAPAGPVSTKSHTEQRHSDVLRRGRLVARRQLTWLQRRSQDGS